MIMPNKILLYYSEEDLITYNKEKEKENGKNNEKSLDDPGAPIKALKGFQKLSLKPGKTEIAKIELDGEAFEYYDESIDELSTKVGHYQILYGTSSLDKDLKAINFVVN